ncbi:MAG: TolC family protein [Methylococcaceae bacterium]
MKKRLLITHCLFIYALTGYCTENLISDPFATHLSSHHLKDSCQLNTENKQAWTLIDVVNQALCHNPQTQQAWANARLQAEQVAIAKSAYLPSINLNTSLSQSMNSSSSSLQVTTISNTTSSKSAQPVERITPIINLSYLLYNFGAREAQLKTAQKTLEAANWTHDALLQAVMFSAIQSYYQLFATQAATESALIAEKSSTTILNAAQKRHEIGTSALVDVLLAQTALAQAKLNTQKSQGEVQIAKGNLAIVLGFDADYSLTITPPQLIKPDAEQNHYIHDLITQAKNLRPDLAAAEAKIKAAQAGIESAQAGHLPSLSLVGNYAYNVTSLPSQTESWTIGMQLNIPLFNGFNTTYQIRSAKEQLAVQQANYTQLEQSVSLEVWQAYQLLMTAYNSFISSEALVASAEQTEKATLGRYNAGVGSMIDLLNAQTSLAGAKMQLIQAQYTWLIQKAQLAKALGQLDSSSITG